MEEEEENEDPHGHITSLAVFRRFLFFIQTTAIVN
jgi:hypothetical protein